MKKRELLVKSREAMLAAVQVYNNPQIMFKSENFIVLSIIAWTYLMHCYYANQSIDYRYWRMIGKRKVYDRTHYKAYKHWDLYTCLEYQDSPIDNETTNNLKFLIGIRHEIEHQMTKNIDNSISAKIFSCSTNYNFYIKELFGNAFGLDELLGLAVQFSPIIPSQEELLHEDKVVDNVNRFICSFEEQLSEQEILNPRYAYRVLYTRLNAKREGQADQVIEFLSDGTAGAEYINKTYMLVKETEKRKYLGNEIVAMMNEKGYTWFNTPVMTKYWKDVLGGREQFGIYITKNQWMWYQNWIPVIEDYCKKENKRRQKAQESC